MKPIHKILVAVDFSSHSDLALDFAVDLSQRYQALLLLAYVYQPVSYAVPDGFVFYTANTLAEMLTQFDKSLQTAQQRAAAAGAQQVQTKLLQGNAADEIVNHAREAGFDLIVAGTHGRTGFAHAVLGSVAEKIVRRAHCPVLTVRLPRDSDG